MKTKTQPRDITSAIGPCFGITESAEITMYSYARPAYNFWQGFYEGLIERGLTHEEAAGELSSKGTRWLMDHHEDELQALGKAMAKTYELCTTKR